MVGRPFIDTDLLLETLYASSEKSVLTCSEIYDSLGERGFRALERRALLSLESVQGAIIALGGGTLLAEANQQFLRGLGTWVYLSVSEEVLKKRGPSRFRGSDEERRRLYQSLPARQLDLSDLSEGEILHRLQEIFHGK